MAARPWPVWIVLLGLLPAATARAQSQQEKRRTQILDELGLKKKPPAPATEQTPPPSAGEPDDKREAPADAGTRSKEKGGGKNSGAPAGPSFARAIHPVLVTTCKPCHSPGAPGGMSRFLLAGDPAADHRAVARFVDVRNPEASALLAKVSGGAPHVGGPLWPASGAPYQRMLAWIKAGARLDAAAAMAAPVAVPAPAATPTAPAPGRTPAISHTGTRPAETGASETPPEAAATPGPESSVPAPPTVPAPPASSAAAAKPTGPTFASAVHPILMTSCSLCHRPGGPAAMTRLLLAGDAAKDEATVRAFVDIAAPESSPLVAKATGQMHGGGAVLPPGDPRLATILAWAHALATAAAPAPASETVPAAPGTAVVTPAAVAPPAPAAAPAPVAPHGHGGPAGLALPLGFMLDGRFSLDYERRQFTGDPFGGASINALRSYHHFLFLSRDAAGEPCGLSIEILSLQFWEAHCRVKGLPGPTRLTVAGGKIVVPFGADPLFHQNYGGLGGFDQPVLPVIWATEGAAAHLVYERRALVVTDDLFVVRGYALPHADSIINLQSGFSAEDATKLGFGNRLGFAWMFASAWYSAYYNPLGFGRRLFMQALDVTVSRPRGIPVLQHFSLGAGLLRADVSGGGAGVGGVGFDYYDFADYLQLRYYPFDWLYIQYRTGLRTFDNRRGVVVDNARLTSADASTHNFAVVARYRGLTVGLYYFINLEKVDEIPNDLVRLSVVYEF